MMTLNDNILALKEYLEEQIDQKIQKKGIKIEKPKEE